MKSINITTNELKNRLQKAYSEFKATASSELHDEVMKIVSEAHHQSHNLIKGESAKLTGSEFSHVLSLLDKVPESSAHLPTSAEHLPTKLQPDGELLGVGKWEMLDPGWAISFEQWLIHLNNKAPFNEQPQTIQIDDNVSLAICGDWGTGPWKDNAPSTKVANQMKQQNPDYTIHLGDVYYAGTKDEEVNNFIEYWPMGRLGGMTLNSNHEMYNGAHSYFELALKHKFVQQKGCSYFCLENTHWLVIGLDTAYDAEAKDLYLKGRLNQVQLDWLASLDKNKRIIILSHHEGLNIDGEKKGSCYQQVVNALGRVPDFWYWGHLHNGITYKPQDGMHGRCIGHGAVPYGDATSLMGKPNVSWYETNNAQDPEIPLRVKNGFAMVTLSDSHLTECLIDEDGGLPFRQNH